MGAWNGLAALMAEKIEDFSYGSCNPKSDPLAANPSNHLLFPPFHFSKAVGAPQPYPHHENNEFKNNHAEFR